MKGRKSLTRRFMQAVLAQRHEVNYDTPLPELIEGYFPDVHQGITTDNFPPEEGETGRKLVEFWWFSNPALGDGYFPASLRDMLA
ncbi:MAG: hypothetical protein NT094_02665, partial [Candidatus Staskawiczbacteria bacterium]|nr:hypothetical protein [Candidatus Staskawiczbacteria bacterium]